MNIFILVMAFFAALGLIDMLLGGRFGIGPLFERGLTNMGGLALSVVGFYAICVSFVQNNAEAISDAVSFLPFDPSLIIGSLLAPDMGALGVGLNLARTQPLAVFSGALVAGGLGMTVGYQLPVFLAAVKKDEVPGLMRGFVFGLITLPPGLLTGALMLGLSWSEILLNMIPVLVLSLVLIGASVRFPDGTRKTLTVFGNIIRYASYILFSFAVIGLFVPSLAMVDDSYIKDILLMILRMVIVACGGMVFSHIIMKVFPKQIGRVAAKLHVNDIAVVGLILSLTQSLAMLPLYSEMDRRGQIMNAAFSVCGAYILGGQFAFVSSLVGGSQVLAYIICKLISGVLAVAAALIFTRKQETANQTD